MCRPGSRPPHHAAGDSDTPTVQCQEYSPGDAHERTRPGEIGHNEHGPDQNQQDTIDQVRGKTQQPGAGTVGDHIAPSKISDVESHQARNGSRPQPCNGHDIAGDQPCQHHTREIDLVPGKYMHAASTSGAYAPLLHCGAPFYRHAGGRSACWLS
jgi:hypothetical protein